LTEFVSGESQNNAKKAALRVGKFWGKEKDGEWGSTCGQEAPDSVMGGDKRRDKRGRMNGLGANTKGGERRVSAKSGIPGKPGGEAAEKGEIRVVCAKVGNLG